MLVSAGSEITESGGCVDHYVERMIRRYYSAIKGARGGVIGYHHDGEARVGGKVMKDLIRRGRGADDGADMLNGGGLGGEELGEDV